MWQVTGSLWKDDPGVYRLSLSYGSIHLVGHTKFKEVYLKEEWLGLCFQKPLSFKQPLVASRRFKD